LADDDSDSAAPQVARHVPPIMGSWDAFVRGWRPFGGWVCGAILLVRGVVIPIAQIVRHEAIDPLDWVALTALVGMLGLGRYRSRERIAGVTG
jgi:hypothetical protein